MRRSARIEEVDDEGELEEAAEDEEAIEDAGAHAEQPRAKRLRTVQYYSTTVRLDTHGARGFSRIAGMKRPHTASRLLNPGDPEKGERSSLFRVLARTPFNLSVQKFVRPLVAPRAPPPRCGRLQARRRTERLPTISPLAFDLRARPFRRAP